MASIKVGINGFGRIGRNILRAALGKAEVEFVAVNDITSTETLAHLLKYDSVLGNLREPVMVDGGGIRLGNRSFKVLSARDPTLIPWVRSAWILSWSRLASSPSEKMQSNTSLEAPRK